MKLSTKVEIIGQVKKPGTYNFYEGMNLFDLIELGGGFSDSTFWKSVYKPQAEIVRRDPSTRYETVIKINLSRLLEPNYLKSIKLQNLDRFVVHSNLNFFEKENIQILGEVNVPGSYPLISDSETLSDLILRAGGLTNKALKNGISIFRDKKYFINEDQSITEEYDLSIDEAKARVAWQSEFISLMPGDSVVVKEQTGTINVVGEVYNPGLIEFEKGKSVRAYINDAGGITQIGNKNGIVVLLANGVVEPYKWFSFIRLTDGCTIIVNPKENVEPLDITQFATNWSQIVSSLLTAVILTQQINSN